MEYLSIQERAALVLRRNSVFDLREQTAEDLRAAIERFVAADAAPRVVECGVLPNLIEYFIVESGANIYEVRRFYDWVFCECEGFFYSGKACRHIAATYPPTCEKCGREVEKHGELCSWCEMREAKYLKPSTDYKPVKIGNIRI